MSEPAERDLANRGARFVVPPASAGAVVIGVPILGGGLAIVVLSARLMVEAVGLGIEQRDATVAPLLFGVVVTAIGAGLLSWGMRARLWRWRLGVRRSWGAGLAVAEFPWDLRGAAYARWPGGIAASLLALVTLSVLSLTSWFAWHVPARHGGWTAVVVALVLDLLGLLVLLAALPRVGDALKWGTSRLVYRRFPYELGGSLDVRLPDVDALLGLSELAVTLRCVKEEVAASAVSLDLKVSALHEETKKLGVTDVPIGEGEPAGVFKPVRRVDEKTSLDLTFELPDRDLPSQFSKGLARYWELELSADTPGLPYRATFLLPVYAPSSPTAGSAG